MAMIGTTARIGIACRATRYGQIDRSTQRAWDMITASVMPSTIEITRPMIAANAVHFRPSRIAVAGSAVEERLVDHLVRRR